MLLTTLISPKGPIQLEICSITVCETFQQAISPKLLSAWVILGMEKKMVVNVISDLKSVSGLTIFPEAGETPHVLRNRAFLVKMTHPGC